MTNAIVRIVGRGSRRTCDGQRARVCVALVLACVASCTRTHDVGSRLAHVDGLYEVTLTRRDTTAPSLVGPPGRGLVTFSRHELAIAGAPAIRIPLLCEPVHVAVSVSPTRDRVAYRCDARDPWLLVYLDDGVTVAVLTDAARRGFPRGWHARSVDWSLVPSLLDAAPRLVLEVAAEPKALFDRMRTARGEAALAALLGETLSLAWLYEVPARRRDPWLAAFASLSAPHRAPIEARLFEALSAANVAPPIILRALEALPQDDPRLPSLFAARFVEALASSEEDAFVIRNALLRRLLDTEPERASTLACMALTRKLDDRLALIVLGRTRGTCPELASRLTTLETSQTLGSNFECDIGRDARPCTEADFEAQITTLLAKPPEEVPWRFAIDRDVATVVAGRRRDVLPPDLARRLARLHYAVEDLPLPACESVPDGTPCRCRVLLEARYATLSRVPARETSARAWGCTYQIDDAARRIVAVRSCRAGTCGAPTDE